MKQLLNKKALILFVFTVSHFAFSQDTIRNVKFGVIPYQIFSRGPALYLSKDLKKASIELRPSYTIATKWITYYIPTKHDKYFFKGINLQVLYSKRNSKRYLPKFLTGFRYWWYDKQRVIAEQKNVSIASSYSRREYKSKWKVGLILGLEVDQQFDFDSFDFAIFLNGGVNLFEGKEYIHNTEKGMVLNTYLRTSKVERAEPFLAAGIKLGYRKKLSPSIHQE